MSEFLLFLLTLAPLIAVAVPSPPVQFIASLFSPVLSFGAAMPGFIGSRSIYPSVLTLHALGWVCLAIASLRVQTSWHERQKSDDAPHSRREWLRGNAAQRLALRRVLLPVNPMLWLESRESLKRVVLTIIISFIAIGCWLLNFDRTFHWHDVRYASVTVFFLHFVITLLLAFDAGSRFVAARRDGALAVVLATQLSVEEILRGEFLALRRLFGTSLIIILAFDAAWLTCVLIYTRGASYAFSAAIVGLCLLAVLAAHCRGLAWVGFYNGLHAKRAHNAAARAFGTIVALPSLLFGMVFLSGALRGNFVGGMLVFTAVNVINAWIFGQGAYERLKNEFRHALTEHEPAVQNDLGDDYALLK